MWGLPFQATEDEVNEFWSGHGVVQNSVKIGVGEDGRRTGHAIVLFESEDSTEKAKEAKQGEKIGSRWIDLTFKKGIEYEYFEDPSSMPYKSLNSYLNEDNVEKTVKLRGIPFRASADDVVKFFKEEGGSSFEYLNVKDVILDMKEGRSTGFALVFLKD